MHRTVTLCAASLLVVSSLGCADVSEHELSAVLDYDGAHFEGIIRFPDHEDEFSGGDGSCGFTTGNCGTRSRSHGELVSGNLPFEGATLEGDADSRTYDVFLRRSAEDQAAENAAIAKEGSAVPRHRFTCRIYDSELGQPNVCYGTTKRAVMILTPR